jgi:hypothetical protein
MVSNPLNCKTIQNKRRETIELTLYFYTFNFLIRYPTKFEVETANNNKLKMLEGEEHVFPASDYGDQRELNNFMAPKILKLKVGAQVMLLKNIKRTLVNGSIGKVIGFEKEDEKSKEWPVVHFANDEVRRLLPEEWSVEKAGGKKKKKMDENIL